MHACFAANVIFAQVEAWAPHRGAGTRHPTLGSSVKLADERSDPATTGEAVLPLSRDDFCGG